jgi:hypothetical protein
MNSDEKVCSICLCEENDDAKMHALDCGHKFHVDCILSWYKSGGKSCPMCRHTSTSNTLSFMDTQARYSLMRARARRKDAPKSLKRIYEDLLKLEKERKNMAAERKAFMNENKELVKKYKKQRQTIWSLDRRIYKIKRKLGVYVHKDVPMPLVCSRRWTR